MVTWYYWQYYLCARVCARICVLCICVWVCVGESFNPFGILFHTAHSHTSKSHRMKEYFPKKKRKKKQKKGKKNSQKKQNRNKTCKCAFWSAMSVHNQEVLFSLFPFSGRYVTLLVTRYFSKLKNCKIFQFCLAALLTASGRGSSCWFSFLLNSIVSSRQR